MNFKRRFNLSDLLEKQGVQFEPSTVELLRDAGEKGTRGT